jgi:hypothetical protein
MLWALRDLMRFSYEIFLWISFGDFMIISSWDLLMRFYALCCILFLCDMLMRFHFFAVVRFLFEISCIFGVTRFPYEMSCLFSLKRFHEISWFFMRFEPLWGFHVRFCCLLHNMWWTMKRRSDSSRLLLFLGKPAKYYAAKHIQSNKEIWKPAKISCSQTYTV